MNYTRRPNRPDGNVYREMRRRGMKRVDAGGSPINPKALWATTAAAIVVGIVAWILWK